MTEKTQPTDAELDMLIDEVAGLDSSDEVFREFARAALAKWATPPAGAGEPVAYRHMHEDGWEYYDALTASDCPGCEPLYTTPQPTKAQAGAVPLTEAQREAIWQECRYDNGEGWEVDCWGVIDAVERMHNIKGGQS